MTVPRRKNRKVFTGSVYPTSVGTGTAIRTRLHLRPGSGTL